MAENELNTSAKRFLDALEELKSSADWIRIEKEGDSDPHQPMARSLLEIGRWLAEQVVDAQGVVLVLAEKQVQQLLKNISGQMRHGSHAATAQRSAPQLLDELSALVPRIRDFSLTKHDKTVFHEITSQTLEAVIELLLDLGPWATAHAAQRVDRPSGQIAEAQRESERLLTEMRANAESAKQAADEARSEAIKAGAAVFAERFEKAAAASEESSKRWLWAGICTLVLAAGAAVWIMGTALSDAQTGWLWLQPLAGKVFLLSLLTYATTWCGRMSLANRHSASVNRHRANSITTVKAFRESGTADATRAERRACIPVEDLLV